MLRFDSSGIVFNCEENYKEIASNINIVAPHDNACLFFPWTDGVYTQFDILIAKNPHQIVMYNYQGGINGNELFVSIIRKGAWGFKRDNYDLSSDYIAEKLTLGCSGNSATARALTELIINILICLKKREI